MIASYCATFYLVYLISGCNGLPEFDIDNYHYVGPTVLISCVYSEDQVEFDQVPVDGTYNIPVYLITKLNNGKKLSVYVNGIASHVTKKGGTFNFAKEWHKASGSNIIYVTYAHEYTTIGLVDMFLTAKEMITSHRLHFTAKVIRVLLEKVHQQCRDENIPGCVVENTRPSKTTMLGQSFGAYVAAQACIYTAKAFDGELVGLSIGVDPAGLLVLPYLYNQPVMAQGQAACVQVIHTDKMIKGTMLHKGDIEIDVVKVKAAWLNLHPFAQYLHMATAMKQLVLIAEEKGDGHVFSGSEASGISVEQQVPATNQVILGVYSKLDKSKHGKCYTLSLHGDRSDTVRKSIGIVGKLWF